MIKTAWTSFAAPFRTRPQTQPWTRELLGHREKRAIASANAEIREHAKRLEQELALIARDHGKG